MSLSKTEIRMAEIEKHFSLEQDQHPPLIGPEDVPGRPEVIPLQWYTAVLCANHPGAEVLSVDQTWKYQGTTDGQRLTLSYNEVGRAARLPEYLYAKYSPTLRARMLVGINGASAGEVAFYQDTLPLLDIEAPQCYYAGFDQPSCRTFFLLEDVSRTKNARFGTAVDLYINRGMAESMVTQLANFHALYWGDGKAFPAFPYRDAYSYQEQFNEVVNYDELYEIGFRLAQDVIPEEMYARRADTPAATMRSLEINIAATQTLLHQDTHLGNWYVTEDDSMGLVDWQCIATGQWALDVSYALSIALTTEDRRAWEHDLIKLYLRRLTEAGVNELTFDEAWLAYRQQMFHAFCWWIGTLGSSERDGLPIPVDLIKLNIQRTAQTIVDLASFDAIE